MASRGEAILVAPINFALRRDVLRGFAHVPAFEPAPEPVVDHRIDSFLVTIFPASAGAHKQMRCTAHALHAPREDNVRITRANRLSREHDSLESGAAYLVDRHGSYRRRQAGLERCLAGGILTNASLQHVPHDRFIDALRLDLRTAIGLSEDNGTQLRGRKVGKRAKNLPMGVRAADRIKASAMRSPLVKDPDLLLL